MKGGFRAVAKDDHSDFFRNHKKPEKPEKEEDSKDSEPETDSNDSKSVYDIVNPIQTVVGPIGQFIPIPEAMPNHPSIVFFGKRRTGKSYGLRDLMYHCFRDVPFGSFCLSFCFI